MVGWMLVGVAIAVLVIVLAAARAEQLAVTPKAPRALACEDRQQLETRQHCIWLKGIAVLLSAQGSACLVRLELFLDAAGPADNHFNFGS